MTVLAAETRPQELHELAEAQYAFYRLSEINPNGPWNDYGVAALGEHPDAIELHLTLFAWSPRVLRLLRDDLRWLERHARERGKSRLIGATAASVRENRLLSKFAQRFGFTACCDHSGADGRTYQLTSKEV